ncbi:MAG TPA: RNA-binding protein [Candidatus Scybalocola faecigallinarum]|uniref:RNA-binding protein n=1 Tax=Candidatus Scybalocola faecigallinarum TaxID=2840941 RepID=A0A9D1F411_9FIRM|nr:RNA-binding protein [Candidatus Scybalocola faecigallinarum]
MMSAVIGQLVRSKAGHDKGKVFVVVGVGEKWLCLADGQVRFSEKPKKKNVRHVQTINVFAADLAACTSSESLTDPMIKKAIKTYLSKFENQEE